MPIPALRVVSVGRDVRLQSVRIDADRAVDLEPLTSVRKPTVYVLPNRDLERLAEFSNLVTDRGVKHRARPLARLLLGLEGIPLIRGSYRSAGQMLRSVRALLRHADQAGEPKAFLVGAEASIFQELHVRAEAGASDETSGSSPTVHTPSLRAPAMHTTREAEYLLGLLPEIEVPSGLEQRYVGTSPEAQLVRKLILIAAQSEEPVLLLGDTGTGKEVVARCVHDYGEHRVERFAPVNCGAIPRDLFESELFGHERGAYTTAYHRKDGLWKVAGHGTLFLDEIGDLRPDHQAKILRALQEGTIRPVGSNREIKVQARVIAATNRDLYAMVKAGQFREDLYYRLRSLFITTPGLADHPQDIPLLAQFFWRAITRKRKAELPDRLLRALQRYSWPGNARELRAVLASIHALFGEDGIDVVHVNAAFRLGGQVTWSPAPSPDFSPLDASQLEHAHHLKRLEDVIHACWVTLRPIAMRRGTELDRVDRVRADLQRRLVELEALCDPRLFPNEESFSAAHGLCGKLAYFGTMLEDHPLRARTYWKGTLGNELTTTESLIDDQLERLQADL